MATHSSILAWEIPWTEDPGGLQSMGLQRVGRNWTRMHLGTYMKSSQTNDGEHTHLPNTFFFFGHFIAQQVCSPSVITSTLTSLPVSVPPGNH